MKSNSFRAIITLFLSDLISNKTSLKSLNSYLLKNGIKDDKSIAQAICYGVCREYYKLDFLLKGFVKNNTKLQIKVILYIGLYQLLYMRQPAYAVINESVATVKKLKHTWASGLVNAVLRKFDKQPDILNDIPEDINYSFPSWIYSKIKNDYPDDFQSILENSNNQAPMYIRVDTQTIKLDGYIERLNQDGIKAVTIVGLPEALCLDSAVSVNQLPGFDKGLVSVQDISAQRAATLLPVKSNDRVIDACSAPGGKAVHLLQKYPELNIVAIENNQKRISKISENLARCQINPNRCEIIHNDMSTIHEWWKGEKADAILLDVPCSATGVIRRQPDIKLLRTENEVEQVVKLQELILKSAWQVLRQGGYLLYCTCSILKQENSEQIKLFLDNQNDAKLIEIQSMHQFKTDFGYQVLPSTENGDGFYYALLQKEVSLS